MTGTTPATSGMTWVPEQELLLVRGVSVLALQTVVRRHLHMLVSIDQPADQWMLDLLEQLDAAALGARASGRGSAEAVLREVPARSPHEPLTVPEVAARLGVSERRVRQIADAGRFAGADKDRHGAWLIPLDAVVAYRREQQTGPAHG